MKKWISLLLVLLLIGCKSQNKPKLYVFVNKTCGECQQLEKNFLPQVNDENLEIILLDMDDKENVEQYEEALSSLENIDSSLYDQPITPFIYFENEFGAVGYHEVMDEVYLQLIDEALHQKEFSFIPSGVWIVKGE